MKKMMVACVAVASVFVLAGCGSLENSISNQYPMVNVVQDNNGSQSDVYQATGKGVPQVAQALANQKKPKQMSKVDPQRMFLLYPDSLVQVEQDPTNPSNTLIEVSSKQFVENNYNHSFLTGYLTATVLNNVFGWHSYRTYPSGMGYDGYVNRNGKLTKNSGTTGGIRFDSPSSSNSRVRSGGPNAGK